MLTLARFKKIKLERCDDILYLNIINKYLEKLYKYHKYYLKCDVDKLTFVIPENVLNVQLRDNTIEHYLIKYNNYDVGIISVEELEFEIRIYNLYIDPYHRSAGIGKSLLEYIKSIGKNIILFVYRENSIALKFFNRLGFRSDGLYDDMIKFSY